MENRDAFLANIARQLGREARKQPLPPDVPVNDYARTRLSELTAQQRCEAFIKVASEVMLTHCELVEEADAGSAAQRLCEQYGGSPAIVSGDKRLEELGITTKLRDVFQADVWDPSAGAENIARAERAKVGVVYAEYGLVESGGVVLFSSAERGRSVSLLPESSLFVLRKSTIIPRVAQLAQALHQRASQGERMPSCINLISGPSSTADIELIKVVGVHGPISAACLIINDC
ncbi:lactate utilization protein C [Erwinia sp. HR93]|uniref:LutC/YkgG family protein n=1 Tax=Erwinia sp. HR93 TaxID=3094840 RepID=UPI002ADECC40|nr:lactate utilization protein C [Erwinia sp. HR93]MEA1063309.1 lactate utilization protein C [Erwinia sp. HR93]